MQEAMRELYLLVGHGLSQGERMQISDFSIYCNDVIQHVRIIRNKHPNILIFIMGHSMVSFYVLTCRHTHHHQQQHLCRHSMP